MEKIWFKSYPKDVAHEIDPKQLKILPEIVKDAVDSYKDNIAFQNFGSSLTFNELDQLSSQFASFLIHSAKLKKGDRIAIQMPNLLQYPIALMGALRAGLVIVNINPLYTEVEMLHQFQDSGAKALVIFEPFAHKYNHIKNDYKMETVITTKVGDLLGFPKSALYNFVLNLKTKKELKSKGKEIPSNAVEGAYGFHEALNLGANKSFKAPEIDLEDTAFLQYTGGTTGVAKAAELSHKNVAANMLQIKEWMKPLMVTGEEIILTPLPLYHIFSLTVNCFAFMYYGAKNVLITNPRDIPGFIKTMKKEKYTAMSGVNTLFNALMHHPDFEKLDFSSLKISVAGGMALQNAVCLQWEKITKSPLVEGYGLTETSPVACVNPIDGTNKIDHIGLPVPSTDCMIIDENEKEVPLGSRGELCVKGPQVMKGYWKRPEEDEKVFFGDGWLKTGDIATVDEEGFFKIVDRKKDIILVSGFNVYPNEVEDALAAHPGILEVAAIGVPDDQSGERVKVFVVKKDSSLTEKEVRDFAKSCLTGYKVPGEIEFRTELPKSNVGKILRKELRAEEHHKHELQTQ